MKVISGKEILRLGSCLAGLQQLEGRLEESRKKSVARRRVYGGLTLVCFVALILAASGCAHSIADDFKGVNLTNEDIALIMAIQGQNADRQMQIFNDIANSAHDSGIENLRRIPAPGANRYQIEVHQIPGLAR